MSNSKTVDVHSFGSISCSDLATLGSDGRLNPEFCAIYPSDIGSLCGCHRVDCGSNHEVVMQVTIKFDNSPSHISFFVETETGIAVCSEDFANYANNEKALALSVEKKFSAATDVTRGSSDRRSIPILCQKRSSLRRRSIGIAA